MAIRPPKIYRSQRMNHKRRAEFDSLPEKLPPPQVHAAAPQKTIDLRHTVIGVIFEGEEKLEQGLTSLKRSGDIVNRAAVPILKPLQKIGKIFPGQKGFDQLVQRGQSKVDRWENRGREEETKSRQLAQEAATSTVDQSILYMAENKAITELIQTQGMSLAEQILELVRSDAVSADYFFEGLVRYVLRRKPRYLMPPPDLKVQEQATWTLRDIRHKDL